MADFNNVFNWRRYERDIYLREVYHDSRVMYLTPCKVVFCVKFRSNSHHEGTFSPFVGVVSPEKFWFIMSDLKIIMDR